MSVKLPSGNSMTKEVAKFQVASASVCVGIAANNLARAMHDIFPVSGMSDDWEYIRELESKVRALADRLAKERMRTDIDLVSEFKPKAVGV